MVRLARLRLVRGCRAEPAGPTVRARPALLPCGSRRGRWSRAPLRRQRLGGPPPHVSALWDHRVRKRKKGVPPPEAVACARGELAMTPACPAMTPACRRPLPPHSESIPNCYCVTRCL